MPQLDSATYVSQIFWLCLSFGVAFLFSTFISLPRFSKLLHQRQMHMNEKEKSIHQMQKQCDELQLKIKDELRGARQQSQEKIKHLMSQLNAEAIQQKNKFHDQIHSQLLDYENELNHQQKDILYNLTEEHKVMAQHIIDKLMRQSIHVSENLKH